MEKLEELGYTDLIEVNGGDLGPVDQLFDPWWMRSLSAIHDAADLFSGFGDGFIQGFKETNQKW